MLGIKKLGLHNVILKKTTDAKIKECNDVEMLSVFAQLIILRRLWCHLNSILTWTSVSIIPTTADGTKTTAKVCGSTKVHALNVVLPLVSS